MCNQYTIHGVSPGVSIREARSLTGETRLGTPRDTPEFELHESLVVPNLTFLTATATGIVCRVDGSKIERGGVVLLSEGVSREQVVQALGPTKLEFPPKDIVADAQRRLLGYFEQGSNRVNISVMLDDHVVTGLWISFPEKSSGWLGISLW